MNGFNLRPTTPADIPTLHRLMRDFATYERLQARFTITEPRLHDALFGPKPVMDSILVDVDAKTIGFALWYFQFGTFNGRDNLFVEDVYVEPEYRGHRIGYALFRYMARIAIERDCFDMQWNVLDWNTLAIDFYRRIGARPVRGWIAQQIDGDALAALAAGAKNG